MDGGVNCRVRKWAGVFDLRGVLEASVSMRMDGRGTREVKSIKEEGWLPFFPFFLFCERVGGLL